MKYRFFLLPLVVFLVACSAGCSSDDASPLPWRNLRPCGTETIAARIACVPGVTVEQGGGSRIRLYVMQPVDHDDPNGPMFEQAVEIEHVAEGAPVLLERLLFIYGEYDGYSAAKFDIDDTRDSRVFVAPQKTHFDSSLTSLSEPDRAVASEMISRWFGVPAKR